MKIKLPLRVVDANQITLTFWVMDANNNLVCSFAEEQTAQLFADCFSGVCVGMADSEYTKTEMIQFIYMMSELQKRAAEAVEG